MISEYDKGYAKGFDSGFDSGYTYGYSYGYTNGYTNWHTMGQGDCNSKHNEIKSRIKDLAVKLADLRPEVKDLDTIEQLDIIELIVDQGFDGLQSLTAWAKNAIAVLEVDIKLFDDVLPILKALPTTEDGALIRPGMKLWVAHNFGGCITVTPEDWNAIGVIMQQGKLYSTKESVYEYINDRDGTSTESEATDE